MKYLQNIRAWLYLFAKKVDGWMQNDQISSQGNHFSIGYIWMRECALYRTQLTTIFVAYVILVVYALWKEFWWDTNPNIGEADSFSDSFMDFCFYLLGGIVGGTESLINYHLLMM